MNKYLLLVYLLFAFSAQAQNGHIEGNVSLANKPLSFANIQLKGTDFFRGTTTDSTGNFKLESVPEGNYSLTVSSLGLKNFYKTLSVEPSQTVDLKIEMQEDLLNLEQVVVSGTRNKVPVYKSPVIVNKIDAASLDKTQSLTISEGLNFSPGLRVETNCQNCGFTQLRMNGLEGAYSQILINSRPIFSALAGVYGLDMIPANMVDRIEVVKGGGSVLFGGNAIAGTVNIITKDPVENSFQVGLNQAFTGIEKSDRTISLNGSVVSNDLEKGMTFYAYRRNRAPWDANGDVFSEVTKLENNTFGLDAFWNISSQSTIKLNAYSINEFRRGGNKFDLEPHQTDITEQLKHNIIGASLTFDHFSKNNKHHFSTYASSQFTNRDSYYGGGGRVLQPDDTLTEADLLAINAYGKSKDISIVGGVRYTIALASQAELTIGSEYLHNKVSDAMPGYGRTIDQKVGTLGSYLQIEWDPLDNLCIIGGGRFDYVNIDGNYELENDIFENKQKQRVFVPRLALMYEISRDFKARISYAQGYRTPQAFDEDLHIETVGGAARFIKLDENLQTEKSNSVTASLNYTSTIKKTQSNLVLEGFFTQLRNPFILSDPVELASGIAIISKRNGGDAYVQGINLEANFAFSKELMLQFGFTGQSGIYAEKEQIWEPTDASDTRPATETKKILRTPNYYGFFTLSYSPIEALEVSWSGVYTGPMNVPHIIEPETEYTIIERTPHFFDTNLKLSYNHEMQKDFYITFFAGLQNILNSYQSDFDLGANRDAGYVYGPSMPRSVFFGMNFGLNKQ